MYGFFSDIRDLYPRKNSNYFYRYQGMLKKSDPFNILIALNFIIEAQI